MHLIEQIIWAAVGFAPRMYWSLSNCCNHWGPFTSAILSTIAWRLTIAWTISCVHTCFVFTLVPSLFKHKSHEKSCKNGYTIVEKFAGVNRTRNSSRLINLRRECPITPQSQLWKKIFPFVKKNSRGWGVLVSWNLEIFHVNSKKLGVQAPQKVKLCYEAPIPKSCREQSYRRQPIIWPNKIDGPVAMAEQLSVNES